MRTSLVRAGSETPRSSGRIGNARPQQVLSFLIGAMTLLSIQTCRSAERSGNDALCLATVFGDEFRADVNGTRAQSVSMSPEERYEFLVERVLPVGDPAAVVIPVDFAPACPAPVTAALLNLRREAKLRSASVGYLQGSSTRVSVGADLISPAIDLVDAAVDSGRLDELRRLTKSRSSSSSESKQSRLAMLALIEMAAGRFEEANEAVGRLHGLVAASPVLRAERGPVAVVIWVGNRHPQMREAVRDLTFLAYEQARNQMGPRSERWHRHLYSMKHALQRTRASVGRERSEDPDRITIQQPLRNWIPVSRMTAETCGRGFPLARWQTQPGRASHITCHDHDYLFYAVPMTGDFEVEADLTTFGYRDIQLAAGSFWAGPGYDCLSCLNGNFRHDFPPLRLEPKLTRMFDWMRVRLVVRNGVRTTYVNGRNVFSRPHDSRSDPWIAIHSPWYTSGSVRDLRVTCDSEPPESVDLAASPGIPGWLPYFDESAGHEDSDWQLDTQQSPPVLIGRRKYGFEGAHFESLLRYHRPIAEDGVISYEFYYAPNRLIVHPALGRLAFLLDPDGVQIHWITDGRFESTGLDPANAIYESGGQRGPAKLSLIQDAWNRLRLEVVGDLVRLSLNDELIYERRLEAINQRTFGLFHFADRSDVHVRNIRWKGSWPRSLPLISDQELAGHDLDEISASRDRLPAEFRHDFSGGLPRPEFEVLSSGGERRIERLDDGVRVTRPEGQGWPNTSLVPKLEVYGDFDITAEFSDFSSELEQGGAANIQLYVELEDENRTECRVFRTRTLAASASEEQLAQAAVFFGPEDKRGYDFIDSPAEAASSGRLRLARRGGQLYFLFAEEDSPFFRKLATRQVPSNRSRSHGIRLMLETPHGGTSSVTWNRIEVRAESLTGAAMAGRERTTMPIVPDFEVNPQD